MSIRQSAPRQLADSFPFFDSFAKSDHKPFVLSIKP